MMRKKKSSRGAAQEQGNDSFLDVIANLVGILIILVVIVGASANQAWSSRHEREDSNEKLELASAQQSLETMRQEALNYENDHNELLRKIEQERVLALSQERVRQHMLGQLLNVQNIRRGQQQDLNERQKQQAELLSQVLAAEKRVQDAQSAVAMLAREANQDRKQVIDHYPSPIARTVFNQEHHFQLKNNRLARVPLDELVELLKAEVRLKAQQLAESGSATIETVGPIDGFRLQYLLTASTVSQDRLVPQRAVEFEQFILVPSSGDLGEPFDQALQPGSEFRQQLEKISPTRSTISVWVYPENYGQFRQLKKWLQQRDYVSAAWPLSAGAPISGGPQGFRASAQ